MQVEREARFWSKVQRGEGCWEWLGARTKDRPRTSGGYGIATWTLPGYRTKSQRAHRIAYLLTYGPVPPGMLVCHRCDNRGCVRPDHLFLGTSADNSADAKAKGRMRKVHPDKARRALDLVRRGVAKTHVARWLGISRSALIALWQRTPTVESSYGCAQRSDLVEGPGGLCP